VILKKKGFEIMFTEIRDITTANKNEILALQIAHSQEGFIETPAECIEEAEEVENFVPVGLYLNNTPIGFAMYGKFPDKQEGSRIWLDRYLIDFHHQGKGYGHVFLKELMQFLTQKYNCPKIYLSVYENNQGAIHLYTSHGFRFNGELDDNGEKVMIWEKDNVI